MLTKFREMFDDLMNSDSVVMALESFFTLTIFKNMELSSFVIDVIVERKLSLVSHPNLIVYYAWRNRHSQEDSAYTRKLQN